jgi:hypothetical protein
LSATAKFEMAFERVPEAYANALMIACRMRLCLIQQAVPIEVPEYREVT